MDSTNDAQIESILGINDSRRRGSNKQEVLAQVLDDIKKRQDGSDQNDDRNTPF